MDSEPLNAPDDAPGIFADMITRVRFKYYLLLFLAFIIVSSDVFIDRVLTKFTGATDYKCANTKGTVIQAGFLVLLCVVLDVFAGQKII